MLPLVIGFRGQAPVSPSHAFIFYAHERDSRCQKVHEGDLCGQGGQVRSGGLPECELRSWRTASLKDYCVSRLVWEPNVLCVGVPLNQVVLS